MKKTFGAVLLDKIEPFSLINKNYKDYPEEFPAPNSSTLQHGTLSNFLKGEGNKDLKVAFAPQSLEMSSIIKAVMVEEEHDEEEPFYIVDLSAIVKQVNRWRKNMPRVEIFYAVKCNPSPYLVQVLHYMNCSFDCASKDEIQLVKSLAPSEDFPAGEKIIFANPCKQISHIRYASKSGVKMVTVDNTYELDKIHKYWPDADIVIRIITNDSNSLCQFSSKFGATLKTCEAIIKKAKELGLNLVGVSFHVGSGCKDTLSYERALKDAHTVFKMANDIGGYNFHLLDIGGGFPGAQPPEGEATFEEIAEVVTKVTDELFPKNVRIIAEPGRYIATTSHILCCNVHAKRDCREEHDNKDGNEDVPRNTDFLYYINDGVYGGFNCIFFDHCEINKIHLLRDEYEEKTTHKSTVFGPTCDSLDKIVENIEIPELNVGDWVYFPDFGSYTLAASSNFNGFQTTKRYFVYQYDTL